MKTKTAYIAILITFIIAAFALVMSGCSSYTDAENTTTESESTASTTSSSYNNYNYNYNYDTTPKTTESSYSTSRKSTYSYGGYSYSTTSVQTYKQDDPYYRANDYNNDGRLSQEEFQGAVNDWMDAHGY